MMRVLNCFPANQLENARLKLSSYLIGIISQVLVPSLDHTSMIPLFEVMTITSSVQNNIRGERMNQLQAEFSRSVKGVSITFEDYAKEQQVAGLISEDNYLSSIIRD
jgi:Tfp pilus assembly pilus retraction ATPase PilT